MAFWPKNWSTKLTLTKDSGPKIKATQDPHSSAEEISQDTKAMHLPRQ
jgi:hypothetical protein